MEQLLDEIRTVLDSEILDTNQKYDIVRDLMEDYADAEGDGVPVTIGIG